MSHSFLFSGVQNEALKSLLLSTCIARCVKRKIEHEMRQVMKNLEVSCNLPLFSHQYILLYYCFRCINLLLHVYHLSTTTSCVSSLYYYFMCIVSLPLLLHVYRLSTTTSCVSSLFSASYLLQLVYAVSQKVIYLRTMFRHPYSFTCSLFLLFHSGAL